MKYIHLLSVIVSAEFIVNRLTLMAPVEPLSGGTGVVTGMVLVGFVVDSSVDDDSTIEDSIASLTGIFGISKFKHHCARFSF